MPVYFSARKTGQVRLSELARAVLLFDLTDLAELCHAGGFAPAAAILLRWLFVITVAFHIANETFLFAHLLEALDHLLNRFTCS